MTVRVAVVIAMALILAGAAPAPQTSTFAQLVRQYLAESESRDPLFADSIGIHTYDDRLPDLSPNAREASYAWERAWRARFAALDATELTSNERADLRALTD
ncbi:MAG TPA: DUF885 family protein, partial [Candidatus Binatus sp.]|nr:DUF885 family protein [Candidatus Binatus sp.]